LQNEKSKLSLQDILPYSKHTMKKKKTKYKKKKIKITTKKRGKSKLKQKPKIKQRRQKRKMPPYIFPQVKSALSLYFRQNNIDYYDCGTLNTIAKKCYALIKEYYLSEGISPAYSIENIDLIYNEACIKGIDETRGQFFARQFVGETYMWWDIKALYLNIICSKYFDRDKDRAYFIDYEDNFATKYIYESKETDEKQIRDLYNEIKDHNRNYNISPGGFFRIDEYHPFDKNEKGGLDFIFLYETDNTSLENSFYQWNSQECEDKYKDIFPRVGKSKYQRWKERKEKRLKEWDKEFERLTSQKPFTPQTAQEQIGELKKELEESKQREQELKKELQEIKDMLKQLLAERKGEKNQ